MYGFAKNQHSNIVAKENQILERGGVLGAMDTMDSIPLFNFPQKSIINV